MNTDMLVIHSALLGVTPNSHRGLRGPCHPLSLKSLEFFPGHPERIISLSFRSLTQHSALGAFFFMC